MQKDNLENKNNGLYKIALVITFVLEDCNSLVPECDNSIDDQIIPVKTKYSGIRQYKPKKTVKWRSKNFVCVGSSEMIYDFFLYTGSSNKADK